MSTDTPFAINHLIQGTSNFLLDHAKANIGFYPQEVGIGTPGSTTTSLCVMALWASGLLPDQRISGLIDELFDFQDGERYCFGSHDGSWHNFSTAKSLVCILTVHPHRVDTLAVNNSLSWLIANRNADCKGWGYMTGYPAREYYTYFATEALALAYRATDFDKNRVIYEACLSEARGYILQGQVREGIWGNGTNVVPCPIETLSAMASLKRLEKVFDRSFVTEAMLVNSRPLLEKWFCQPLCWEDFKVQEMGRGFYFKEFFPGNIFMLLPVLGPTDSIVSYSVGWLQNNYVRFNSRSIGYNPFPKQKNGPIIVWATAQALYSIVAYKRMLQSEIVPSNAAALVPQSTSGISDLKKVNAVDLRIVVWLLVASVTLLCVYIASRLQVIEDFKNFSFKDTRDIFDSSWLLLLLWAFIVYQLWYFFKRGRFPLRAHIRAFVVWLMRKLNRPFLG